MATATTDGKAAKAAAVQSLKRLEAILPTISKASCQVNLIKSDRKPDLDNTRCLEITVSLAKQFKEAAAKSLAAVLAEALSATDGVSTFDHQAFADGRIAALPITTFPEVAAWFSKLPPDDKVRPLTKNDPHIRQSKFTTTNIVFSPKGETIRIFRKASQSRLAKRGVIASLSVGNRYDYVDPGSSLIFDMLTDFFVWEDTIFVDNYRSLESILNFREITATVAGGVCDIIFAALPVTAPAALRTAILSGARQLNRIARLKTKPHIPLLDMTIVEVVITKAKLPLKIIKQGGKDILQVDATDPDQIDAFMHVLSDDYVQSMMTKLEYVIGAGAERDLI